MKKSIIPFLAGLVISCAHPPTNAQEFNETISREFALHKDAATSTFAVYNINGSIKVEGYAGNTVVVIVEKKISAGDNAKLESGKKELRLEFEQNADSIIAYLAEPFDSRPNRNRNRNDGSRNTNYDFQLDFTVKVPFSMNLAVSTINHGDILVRDVTGNPDLHNVNGAITLINAKGTTNAFTVNGKIDVTYISNPPGQSTYQTINGDIHVKYNPDLSADMQFKSMQGDLYTDFPNAKILPAAVTRNTNHEGDGTVYTLNKTTTIRIGAGGNLFRFETLNGNVYIIKQS
jgi:hypothetical protein